jgi:hypothetical protein
MIRTLEQAEARIQLLKSALEGLIGVSSLTDLVQMRETMKVLPVPEEYQAVSIAAINALLELHRDQNS